MSPSLFSFDNIQDNNVSHLLNSNKRAFARAWKEDAKNGSYNLTPVHLNKDSNLSMNSKNSPENKIKEFNFNDLEQKLSQNNQNTPKNLHSNQEKYKKKIWKSEIFENFSLKGAEKSLEHPQPIVLNGKQGNNRCYLKKNCELSEKRQLRINSECKNSESEKFKGVHLMILKTPKRKNELSENFEIHTENSHEKNLKKGSLVSKSLEKHKKNYSFRQERDRGRLRSFINDLVEKNFGFKQKVGPICNQEIKVKRKNEKSCGIIPDSNDDSSFLSTGYLKYHNNLPTKLKISKMLLSQHKQERRQTQLFYPTTKKSPKDNN